MLINHYCFVHEESIETQAIPMKFLKKKKEGFNTFMLLLTLGKLTVEFNKTKQRVKDAIISVKLILT